MTSIRFRLNAYLVGGIGLLIVAAGITLEIKITGWLEREFDRALEAKARALVTLTKEEEGEVELDFADEFMPEFSSEEDSQYFEIWLDGALLERSDSFEIDGSRSEATLPREPDLASVARFSDTRLPDGRSGRLARVDFVPQIVDEGSHPAGEPTRDPTEARATAGLHSATVLVARERETLEADIRRLRSSLVLFLGLLLGTLVGLVALALKIGLRPLHSLAHQVQGLDAGSLDRRVGGGAPPRELAPVVEQINQLLSRLESSFNRERRLTSDIAHELKTPIAELRSLGEVGARWPEDPEMTRKFFEDARGIALQMERIVVHLLALARFDEGQEVIELVQVPIAAECDEAWQRCTAQAKERSLGFRNLVPDDASLDTDPDKLRMILSNLLSNAVEYSRPGTLVSCELTRSDRATTLSVSSSPTDLDPQDLKVMFDRFWRKDAARSGGRNVGLGLAIVRAFADLLDLTLEACLDADGLLRISLSQVTAVPRPSTKRVAQKQPA